ncbi:hypothetical protein NQ318_006277 [Aromia moschata]|uniref:MADF domain-containing protein n=1 Tax=Aromia moschata TaxID=1265417 RepID=A0AAV8YXS7_9CUCU|nr:hypothetical protein NQ318_006277 [Aromia moschata]
MPCLWKVKSKEYLNKNLKNEGYDKLVEFCKPIFSTANRDFVYKKIQSLRGAFRKEFKKVSDSIRSGKGAEEIYSPTLWYYDLLLFTIYQEKPNESISNVDDEDDPPLTLNIFPPLTLPLNILFVEHRTTPCRFLELLPRVRNLKCL